MFRTWVVWKVRCLGCGMLGLWHVEDVECSGCTMFGMWNVDLQNAQ